MTYWRMSCQNCAKSAVGTRIDEKGVKWLNKKTGSYDTGKI